MSAIVWAAASDTRASVAPRVVLAAELHRAHEASSAVRFGRDGHRTPRKMKLADGIDVQEHLVVARMARPSTTVGPVKIWEECVRLQDPRIHRVLRQHRSV